jgi:methyltransferase (TIGR00027 family)
VVFVAVDFAHDALWERLLESGFDPARPAFVAWLGVTVYLTPEAVEATLRTVARFAPGSEIIVGYAVPRSMQDAAGQAHADVVMAVAASYGEPWQTFYTPAEMAALLTSCGFEVVEQPDGAGLVDAALWDRTDGLAPLGLSGHARACVGGGR